MSKQLRTLLLPEWIPPETDLSSTAAVVIDVLRATTVMTTAGAAGVGRIHTRQEVAEARSLAQQLDATRLLCGERQCQPIEGFDLGNSPRDYTPERVSGRDMILTTTNGTKAINAVGHAKRILVACFANLKVVADQLIDEESVLLVCAGTHGEVTAEDVLLAGGLIDTMAHRDSWEIDDASDLARLQWQDASAAEDGILTILRRSRGGRNLLALGYDDDVIECSRTDTIDGWVERTSGIGPSPQFRFRSC